MNTPSANDAYVQKELRHLLMSGQLVLCAGSGLSAQAATLGGRTPPLWDKLLVRMALWSHSRMLIDDEYTRQVIQLVREGYLCDAGQMLTSRLGKQDLRRCIIHVSLCNKAKAGEAHRHAVRLPFRAFLTTNYDRFIEDEYRRVNDQPIEVYYENAIVDVLDDFRERRPFVFKLHGDIGDSERRVVLGERSYDEKLYMSEAYRDCMKTIFLTASILFVGYGGKDPNLNSVMGAVAALEGRPKRHWMLTAKGSMLPVRTETLRENKGINVIEYPFDPKHTGVARLFRQLLPSA